MSMERILSEVRSYEGVCELHPAPGSEYPEISWGDHFFYYSSDGRIPSSRQPYATIVTKDYPGDTTSRLGEVGRWRLNIHVGRRVFAELLGYTPSMINPSVVDHAADDVFNPHPMYGEQGWVGVVNPGVRTCDSALLLLQNAHLGDRRRVERRCKGS